MPAFYEVHADAFSKSRFRIWPLIKQFLVSLPSNATVLDIGCGNGKNMVFGLEQNLQMFGLEQSQQLCKICESRGLNVIQGDARSLPFPPNTFDAIIMIAVIHHIDPTEHLKTLIEIQRVLKPGGTCLISNWAVEQPENAKRTFQKGLNMVEWKGKEATPLPYWVMDEQNAKEFIHSLPINILCINLKWDAGNWYFTLQKQ